MEKIRIRDPVFIYPYINICINIPVRNTGFFLASLVYDSHNLLFIYLFYSFISGPAEGGMRRLADASGERSWGSGAGRVGNKKPTQKPHPKKPTQKKPPKKTLPKNTQKPKKKTKKTQKNPKKSPKKQKTQRNHWAGFFFKPGFFPTLWAGGAHPHADAPDAARPPRQDLRHELGLRLQVCLVIKLRAKSQEERCGSGMFSQDPGSGFFS